MSVAISTVQVTRPAGSQRESVREVTFDNSYAEGGEILTFSDLGLRKVSYAKCWIIAGSESATLRPANAYYTPATEKIHLIDSATGKEMESTKDMSKVKVLVEAVGY
jgi:hypothetical protein